MRGRRDRLGGRSGEKSTEESMRRFGKGLEQCLFCWTHKEGSSVSQHAHTHLVEERMA